MGRPAWAASQPGDTKLTPEEPMGTGQARKEGAGVPDRRILEGGGEWGQRGRWVSMGPPRIQRTTQHAWVPTPKQEQRGRKGELAPCFYTETPMWFKLDKFLITYNLQLLARLGTVLHSTNSYIFLIARTVQRSFCYRSY